MAVSVTTVCVKELQNHAIFLTVPTDAAMQTENAEYFRNVVASLVEAVMSALAIQQHQTHVYLDLALPFVRAVQEGLHVRVEAFVKTECVLEAVDVIYRAVLQDAVMEVESVLIFQIAVWTLEEAAQIYATRKYQMHVFLESAIRDVLVEQQELLVQVERRARVVFVYKSSFNFYMHIQLFMLQ